MIIRVTHLRILSVLFSIAFFSSCEKQNILNPLNKIDYINVLDTIAEVKYIALTFDDGPDNKFTPLILDILKEKNVVATFFSIGNKMKEFPEVTRRIVAEGHCLANHTINHLRLTEMPLEVITDNLLQTEKIIESFGGGSQKIFRPPFGLITKKQTESLTDLGYRVVLWNLDSKDFVKKATVDNVVDNVVNGAGNQKVVLFHCADYAGKRSRMITVMALPKIIDKLRSRNYVFVKVSF
jgi:peptidoglycan/xylan/chitin deacetylase (PgdA/CDA1 family)